MRRDIGGARWRVYEHLAHFLGRRTGGGTAVEHVQDQAVHFPGNAGTDGSDRGHRAEFDRLEDVERGFPGKGMLAGGQLIQDAPSENTSDALVAVSPRRISGGM